MAVELLVGIDVGTTMCKAGTIGLNGDEIVACHEPTPWQYLDRGVEIDPDVLADTAVTAAAGALAATARRLGDDVAAVAVGVTSMAETGALLDRAGSPVAPAIAWHDDRGAHELEAIGAGLGADAFVERTGLPVSPLCTLAKLAWMRRHWHVPIDQVRWRNVAELVVDRLGGDGHSELSLAARTGLLDANAATWWEDARAWLGAGPGLLADVVAAGTPMGTVDRDRLAGAEGAVLTVAGHDHLVCQIGTGATHSADVLNSCGTAETFTRAIDPGHAATIAADAVAAGVECGWHAIPGQRALLAGLRTGNGLARVRALLGVDPADTAALDDDALADPDGAAGMTFDDFGSPAMALRNIGAQPTPAKVWHAALSTATGQAHELLTAFERLAGPRGRLVATGGWLRSRGFRETKRRALGDFVDPGVNEAGIRGAALMAGLAAGRYTSVAAMPAPG